MPPELPPLEPPPELRMTNPALWRVAARWLRDHQPDRGGGFCRYCSRAYPCSGAVSADDVLDTAFRRAAAPGRVGLPKLNRRTRNV